MPGWIGLDEPEAAHRLATEGPNELAADRGQSLFRLFRDVLSEPMFLLLLGAVAVYRLLGDPVEAVVLACSLLAVIVITVYQERRTERAPSRRCAIFRALARRVERTFPLSTQER